MSDPVQECTLGLEVSVTSTRPDFGPLPWKPSSEYRIDVDYWAWAVVEPGHQVYEHPEFNQDMTLATFDMTFPCMGVYTLIFTWGRHAIRYWYATGKTDEHFDTEEIKALAIIFDCGSGLGKPCVVILGTGVRGGLPERTPASAGAKRPAGPSAGDPPEICSGSEDYRPGVDLAVYNPNGPEFIFERNWRTDLATGQIGSPGLAEGWAHNWDVRLNPMGEACTWHGLEVRYPSGRGETITPLVDGSGAPTGLFEIPDGLGFEAVGDPGPNIGEWWSITFTFADGSTWRFTPHRSGYYALTRVGNALGQYLAFGYDDIRRLVEVTDAATDEVLATLTYGEDGYLSQIVDTYGRLVAYTHEQLTGDGYGYEDLTALTQVSQVVPFDEDTPPMRWQYDYAAVSALPDGYGYGYGQPDDCPYEEQGHYHGVDYYGVGGGPWRDTILLLNTITVPSPTQQGEETATLRYYDTTYRLCEQIDANGVRTVFIYESGTTTAYVVDADSDIVQTTEYSFDSNGMLTSSTCAGCPTSFEYNDPLNPYKPTKVTAADGKVTTFSYDSKGNLSSTTDPRGVTLTYTYDYDDFALGRLVKVERTVGGSTITLNEYTYYEPSGLTETAKSLKPGTTSAELVTTSYTYDDLGNVLTVTTPGNDAASTITTTYEYDTDGSYSQTAKRGQPLYVEDALGHQTHFRYDERANRTETTDALGSTWRTFYNLANQVTRSEQPATDQTGSGHATVLNTYLYVGGPQTDVTVLDEGGDVVQHINYHYGQEGELLSVTGGTEPVTYTYNALYQQETLTDGDGHTTAFAYDTKQRLKLIRYPLASADTGYDTVRFTLYDDAGRLLQRIDGRDIVTNYSYTEAGGALTDIAYPDHSAQDVSFGYDALGRRTSMSDAEGSHSYGYDDAGTLLSHAVTYTGLSAKTVSYTYYDNGSRATMTTPAGTQTYGYDEAGRMTSLQYGLGTASWAYQDNNLLSQQTLPNGCYTDYGYNAANQLTDLVNKTSGGSTLSGYLDFLYLGTGDLSTVTSSIPGSTSLQGQVDYGYDHKRQLTLEDSDRNGGYSDANVFDGAGNATTFRNSSKTYNADNQLTGPGTYVYDGNGNPTTWSGTSLTFDVENRMTAYGTTLTAGYRGDGLRAWKNTASGQTYFLYDGISVVCELDSSGNVLAGSTYGAAGLLSRGSVQYQFDHLGDATIRLDGSGNVLSYRLFDAWGNELSGGTEPYGYRARYGYYADSETGLIALAFRYYAPGVGRFLNRDPRGHHDSVNLMGYCQSDPVRNVDPNGLQWWVPVVGGGLVLALCWSIYDTLHQPTPPVHTKVFGTCSSSSPSPTTYGTGQMYDWANDTYCHDCHTECMDFCGGDEYCSTDCGHRYVECLGTKHPVY